MKLLSIGLFSIMGILGIAQTVLYMILRINYERWPIVAAKITHSRLLNTIGANGEELLEAIIYFEYSIRGKDYTANTPVLKGYELFPSLSYEYGLVRKYPKGEVCNVRVHPEDNEIAYLEVAPLSMLSTILAPLMTVGSIVFLVAYSYGALNFLFGA